MIDVLSTCDSLSNFTILHVTIKSKILAKFGSRHKISDSIKFHMYTIGDIRIFVYNATYDSRGRRSLPMLAHCQKDGRHRAIAHIALGRCVAR